MEPIDWTVCDMKGNPIGTYRQERPFVSNRILATAPDQTNFWFNIQTKDENKKKLFGQKSGGRPIVR